MHADVGNHGDLDRNHDEGDDEHVEHRPFAELGHALVKPAEFRFVKGELRLH